MQAIVREKIDILAYISNNPRTTSSQLNNFLIIQQKSKKTTSTICKYVRELVSSGYLTEFGYPNRRFSITKDGKFLLDSISRTFNQDTKKQLTINVIIISPPKFCPSCYSQIYFNPKRKNFGGYFY